MAIRSRNEFSWRLCKQLLHSYMYQVYSTVGTLKILSLKYCLNTTRSTTSSSLKKKKSLCPKKDTNGLILSIYFSECVYKSDGTASREFCQAHYIASTQSHIIYMSYTSCVRRINGCMSVLYTRAPFMCEYHQRMFGLCKGDT